MTQPRRVQIFVFLPDEAVDVWRPVDAEQVSDELYRIVSENPDPEDERWEFSTGEVVRCVLKEFYGGKYSLVAIERVGT